MLHFKTVPLGHGGERDDGRLLRSDRLRGGTLVRGLRRVLPWERDATRRQRSARAPNVARPSAAVLRIAIVDEEVTVCQSLSAFARAIAPTARVTAFGDAESALEHLRREPHDLLLLDLRLPGMSGVDLAARLRASAATADIAIIALSANPALEDRQKLGELGVGDVIRKGPELATQLPNALRRRTLALRA